MDNEVNEIKRGLLMEVMINGRLQTLESEEELSVWRRITLKGYKLVEYDYDRDIFHITPKGREWLERHQRS